MTTVIQPDTKKCSVCGETKPLDAFRARSDTDGRASACKPCHSQQCADSRRERTAAEAVALPAPKPPRGWRDQAACRDHDPEMWFADTTSEHDQIATGRAKRVCATCPSRKPCGDHALSQPGAIAGVWGGLDERDRRAIKRAEAERRAASA